AHEPLRERRVGPVEHLGERLPPRDQLGLFGPEAQRVGGGTLVCVSLQVRARREIGGRLEPTVLLQQVAEGFFTHDVLLDDCLWFGSRGSKITVLAGRTSSGPAGPSRYFS